MNLIDAVAASDLVNGAVLSSLIPLLVRKGILTPDEAREVYEQALLMLETAQTTSPASQDVFEIARELIEKHLRPLSP